MKEKLNLWCQCSETTSILLSPGSVFLVLRKSFSVRAFPVYSASIHTIPFFSLVIMLLEIKVREESLFYAIFVFCPTTYLP